MKTIIFTLGLIVIAATISSAEKEHDLEKRQTFNRNNNGPNDGMSFTNDNDHSGSGSTFNRNNNGPNDGMAFTNNNDHSGSGAVFNRNNNGPNDGKSFTNNNDAKECGFLCRTFGK